MAPGKRNIFGFIIFAFIISVSIFLYFLNEEKETDINLSQEAVLQEAVTLFENMIVLRKWNAQYGSVYVKQHENLEPNPYLAENVIYTDNNELLIRINSAWMTRQIAEISNENRKDYFYKITSLDLVNPNNTPDKFETDALRYFNNNKNTPYYYRFNFDENKFDFMGALITEKSCITCHKGYKPGDIRGGIRISVPLTNYIGNVTKIENKVNSVAVITVISSLIILIILLWFINMMYKWQSEEKKLSNKNILLHRKVKEEINKNREKDRILYRQAKSAQMGDMISMIAHQWRQPLNAISAASIKLDLKRELGQLKDSDIIEVSKFIQNETQQMSQIINDFMNFFRSDNKKSTFFLSDVYSEISKIVGTQFKNRNISLNSDIDDNIEIFGHKSELVHIMLNLIGNARDAFENTQHSSNEVIMKGAKSNDVITIEVCDNAGGIHDDVLERIFDPYFTTKEQGKGTGIGLYMVKQMIEKDFRGSIRVENSFGDGVCFIISIPAKFVLKDDEQGIEDE